MGGFNFVASTGSIYMTVPMFAFAHRNETQVISHQTFKSKMFPNLFQDTIKSSRAQGLKIVIICHGITFGLSQCMLESHQSTLGLL
jgi:hypothetical protein